MHPYLSRAEFEIPHLPSSFGSERGNQALNHLILGLALGFALVLGLGLGLGLGLFRFRERGNQA